MKYRNPIVPGTYTITCKPNDRIYIGGTGDVTHRIATHKARLRSNSHPITALQTDFNTHGESSFDFKVMSIFLTRDEALSAEETMLQNITEHDRLYNTEIPLATSMLSDPANPTQALLAGPKAFVEFLLRVFGSMAALSKATGVNRVTLYRIKSGKSNNLQSDTYAKLIHALNEYAK